MKDKIVLPAGLSMGGADENWSDISNHQSAMHSHPTAYLLNPCTSCMGAEDFFVKVSTEL